MDMVLITILVGIIGWQLASLLKLPAPGMIGSMFLVGITNIIFSYATFTTPIKIFGVALSGAFIGNQITRDDIKDLKSMMKPFLILITLLTINTFFAGTLIHFICGIDWVSALLSCVAGGATDMSIVAMDLNANAGTVAMMQTLRLIGTLVLFPYWITRLTKDEPDLDIKDNVNTTTQENTNLLDRMFKSNISKTIFTMIIALISGYIGLWSRIPAASMMLPMFVVMFFTVTTNICYVPKNMKLVAQILAGSVVGCSISASTFSSIETTVMPIVILLITYFIINYFFSMYCKKKNLLDLKSAMFASAPGGATDMTLIAADLGADLTKIALIQSFRSAYAVTLMPLLIVLFANLIS